MLRPPVTPKKRTPAVPEQPEIPAAWLEALNNSGTTVASANAGTVSPRKQFTNVRQAEQAIDSRQQAEANYRAYYDKRVPVKTIAPYMGGDVYSDSVGQMIKFAGDNLIKYPLQSFGRTASLQNADTALNPFSGASTSERLMALGEDAINIASVIPGVRTAAQSSAPLKQAGKNFFSGLAASRAARAQARSGWTPPLMQPFEYAPPRLEGITREAREAAGDLALLQQQSMVKPGIEYGASATGVTGMNRPEWIEKLPEGFQRFWHTNPQGASLPSKLSSMKEAARLRGRRGSGATQAFSGGIYNTDSGAMSLTYLDDMGNPVIRDRFPSSVLPKNFVDDLMPGYGVYDKPWMRNGSSGSVYGEQIPYREIGEEIRKAQLDDFRNQFVGLNSRASNIPFRTDSPYYGQDFGDMTVKELLDSVATKEEALAIINDSIRPIVFEQNPQNAFESMLKKFGNRNVDYGMKEAALNQEIRFKHPVVRGAKGSYSKTAVVDPNSGLYLSPNNNFRPAEMPFSEGYYQQIDNLSAQWKADTIKRIQDQMKGWKNTPEQIALHMDDAFFQYLDEVNPYNYFKNRDLQPKFQMGTPNVGGQNYWDLPVVKDSDGVIQSVGDLKAMDIRTAGGSKEMFENLADEWKDFIYQNYPQLSNDQGVNTQLDALRNLHTSSAKTKGYHNIQNELSALLAQANSEAGIATDIFGDLTPKEQFYDYLTDSGYGVIPHTGGEIMGGDVQHLSLNVLKPELLPPSSYVSPGVNFDEHLSRLARARAMQMRYAKSNSTGREFGDFLNKQKLSEAGKQARLAGIQSMLVGSANNTARNR